MKTISKPKQSQTISNFQHLLILSQILIGFLICIFALPNLPAEIPSKIEFNHEIIEYESKYTLFIFPIFSLISYVAFLIIPHIEPKKQNFLKFQKVYVMIEMISICFINIFLVCMILFAKSPESFPLQKILFSCMGLLSIIIGNYMPKMKQNFFLGLRTPWTLTNEIVWIKTHRLGGYCLMVGGLVFFVGTLFFPNFLPFLSLFLFFCCFIPCVASFYYFKKETQANSFQVPNGTNMK